jgi:hypothetical protein
VWSFRVGMWSGKVSYVYVYVYVCKYEYIALYVHVSVWGWSYLGTWHRKQFVVLTCVVISYQHP